MKRKTRKLTLAKENLGRLEDVSSRRVAGAATVNPTCTCTLDRTCPCSAEFACTAISCGCTQAPYC